MRLLLIALLLSGCATDKPITTGCIQQLEADCDGDKACIDSSAGYCDPAPTCDAPPGQHC